MTADGRPYYQNSVTRETSWRKPAGWTEPQKVDTVAGAGTYSQSSDGGSKDTATAAAKGRMESDLGAIAARGIALPTTRE